MPLALQEQQRWPRGPRNKLQNAAGAGLPKAINMLLSSGAYDIDQGDLDGYTALMMASQEGHACVVEVLLSRGANASIRKDGGVTALHLAATYGHLSATRMLVKAGDVLEAETAEGATPLVMAARDGYHEVARVLLEAGAKPDSRRRDVPTPLYMAAAGGHVGALRVILGAGANPLLMSPVVPGGITQLPLNAAASAPYPDVVRQLIEQVGIEGCGGESGGETALRTATHNGHVRVMRLLFDAGVNDDGVALVIAAGNGREESVRLLLQHQRESGHPADRSAYANHASELHVGLTPLSCACGYSNRRYSSRIVRMLVDAGADTTLEVPPNEEHGIMFTHETPLLLATRRIHMKRLAEDEAAEKQLRGLEGVRRLLLQTEAVHALSWLWYRDDAPVRRAGFAEGTSRGKEASTTGILLKLVKSMRRRRSIRRGALLAPMLRHAGKF